MILHAFALSSISYRVRIVLHLTGLAYQSRSCRLRAGKHRAASYLSLDPAGLVPALEVDGQRISQSMSIIDYLDAKHPQPRLVSTDPLASARPRKVIAGGLCYPSPLLALESPTPFAGGDMPDIVDVHLVPQIYNARRHEVNLDPFPQLVAVAERAVAHPAFHAAAPHT